jgi:hypothetical protein
MDDEKRKAFLEWHEKHERVKKEGFAGVLGNGQMVDRREFPDAIPLQKNSLLGIPEPKEL